MWDFGDGNTSDLQNPIHEYSMASSYTVCLIASNVCGTDTVCQTINIVIDNTNEQKDKIQPIVQLFPNPARSDVNLRWENFQPQTVRLSVLNAFGQQFHQESWTINQRAHFRQLTVRDLPPGVYYVRIEYEGGEILRKMVKI